MPHSTLRLSPGVTELATPALNQAGVSSSQLIRYIVDPLLGPLCQKLGGWQKFFPNTFPSVVRALWAWEDTNGIQHLAVGCQNVGMTNQSQLSVITNGSTLNITPKFTTDDVAVNFTTTSGSPTVTIVDSTTTGITSFDTVYIETHVSVGGLILFGLYPCETLSSTSYQIIATDTLGNPENATSSVANGGAVAEFTTTSGSSTVNVLLNNHGYQAESTYPALIATTVGGITIYGNYLVASVVDANNFTITASNTATSSASAFINGGDAQFIYSFGVGAIPPGTGFGIGGFGRGAPIKSLDRKGVLARHNLAGGLARGAGAVGAHCAGDRRAPGAGREIPLQ